MKCIAMNFRYSKTLAPPGGKPGYTGAIALRMAVRLAIGLGLLMFLFTRQADLQSVWHLVRNARWERLLMALAIAITGEVATAWKWSLLVKRIGGRLPLSRAVRASFIGMFYNNFFPGSVGGDVAKILIVARDAGGKARAAASAFMQRNTGLAGLFIIGIPAAFLWPRHLDWPDLADLKPGARWITDSRTWLISAAIGYGAVNGVMFSRRAYDRLWLLSRRISAQTSSPLAALQGQHTASLLQRWVRTITEKIRRFHTELHGYRFWMMAPLLLSVLTQLIDIFLVWNLSQAIGVSIPLPVLMVTVPMVTLANLLPITLNGIGLRETMYIALLHSAGVPASQAMALSLLQFAVMLTLAAVGGALHWRQTSQIPPQTK